MHLRQNDAFPQATDLGTIGTTGYTNLSIHNQSDSDFFRFNAQDSTHVDISLGFLHGDGNLDFVVYDSNQQEIARADSINDDESLRLAVEQGELYYVEVFGVDGAINDYSFDINVPLMVAESGKIGMADQRWQTVHLTHQFDNPVVIVSTPGIADRAAVTVEIENVTSYSFDVRLHNWNTKSLHHSPEYLTYFVIESGEHTLRDGTTIVAGRQTADHGMWTDVNFEESFDATPVVFTQLRNRSSDAFTTRLSDVTENGFRLLPQAGEASQAE